MIASQNQLKTLLLGDNLALSVLPAVGTQVSPANLPAGAVCLVDASGQRVTASTSPAPASKTGKYSIVQSQGATLPLIKSDLIDFSTATINFRLYQAPVEQVSYIGYAGGNTVVGSATIPDTPSVNTTYFGSLNFIDFNVSGNRQIKKEFMYSATTADNKTSITDALCLSAYNAVAKMVEKPYIVERVSNDAGTANTITAGTDATHYTFTKGSKIVVGTDSAGIPANGSDEINATIVAGDYVRPGTALTVGVYKLTAVTSGTGTTPAGTPMTLTLDQPFQGDTVSIAIGSTEYITAALFEASNTGLKFTALAKQYIPQVMRGFEKVRFTIDLDEVSFGTTGITYVTAAVEGRGTSAQIQELERYSQMNQGNRYTSYNPPTQYISNALAYGTTWNTFSISFETEAKHGIVNDSHFPQEILVAGVSGTNTQFSDGTDGLWLLLQTLSGTTFTAWS
jgi:hypothetical protein